MAPDDPSRPFTDGISIGVLTRLFHRDLIDDVLRSTHTTGQRDRLLPGRVTVYFVLALCLFCADPYEEVMRKLVNGLQFLGTWSRTWQVPTSGAMTQARTRLGPAPLAELFDRVAAPLGRPGTTGAWFHGLRVLAVDGVVLDTPDTPANAAEFAKPTGHAGEHGPFPQVRLVGLGECGTHAIIDAAFDSPTVDERELLTRLIPGFAPDTIVLCDRGFYSYPLWAAATATGAHLLWRIKRDLKIPVLQVLPDGSYLSELLPRTTKSAYRGRLHQAPDDERIPVRVVEYAITNRDTATETITVMTTLLDPEITATELAALYQQRWEFELTLDEVETHQMSPTRLLRSKTPDLVRQEIWALLLTHYAVREFMQLAADDLGDDVDHLAFLRAIRVIRRQVTNQAGFSPSPPDHRDPSQPRRNP